MLHMLNTLKVLFLKKISYFWKSGLWALLSLLFFVITVVVILYAYAQNQLPDVASLKTIELQVPLQIFTKDGLLIQEYGEKRRIPIPYDQIPPTLVHAVLATEDQRFFEHPGVDIMGLGRAAISMIQTHRKSQGGSTITMQVARNFFLNSKKTFLRKFNEIMLAIKIDQELSKEKILELYLNQIYLGNRAYGVGAAAQVYYGKALQDLNIAQLAMIAGLPQAPSSHNPIINPLAAKKRRDHVLERLYEEKYIFNEEEKSKQIDDDLHKRVKFESEGKKKKKTAKSYEAKKDSALEFVRKLRKDSHKNAQSSTVVSKTREQEISQIGLSLTQRISDVAINTRYGKKLCQPPSNSTSATIYLSVFPSKNVK